MTTGVRPGPLPSGDREPLRVLIAGGFTGGHLFTALAIAEALRRQDPGADVRLGGAHGGMEVARARSAGLPVETVWVGALARGRGIGAVARNLTLPLRLAVALAQAGRVLDRFRPHVVVGVGAYVSFPFVAAAQGRGTPTLLHEANAVPGVANGLLARRADVVCVALADAAERFAERRRRAGRAALLRLVQTGTPVRPEIAGARALEPEVARARFGADRSKMTVLVTGGSLGSPALNAWMLEEGRRLVAPDGRPGASPRQIIWQCGRAHLSDCRARLGPAPGVHLFAFLDDMPAAYAAADLVIAGAGAGTVAELAALGKPAVIVPDRGVSEDHQARNAEALRRAGVATWSEHTLGARFTARVRQVADDPAQLQERGAAVARLARPEAADAVAAEIRALDELARHLHRGPGVAPRGS